jgi:hypothetical protein
MVLGNVKRGGYLGREQSWVRDIGVRGVPFYLVGDRPVQGEGRSLYATLTESIAAIRKDGCRSAC